MKLVRMNEASDLGISAPKVGNYYNPKVQNGTDGPIVEYRYRYGSGETTMQGAVWFDFGSDNRVKVTFGVYKVLRNVTGTYDDATELMESVLKALEIPFMSVYMNIPSTRDTIITTFLDNPDYLEDSINDEMDRALKRVKRALR